MSPPERWDDGIHEIYQYVPLSVYYSKSFCLFKSPTCLLYQGFVPASFFGLVWNVVFEPRTTPEMFFLLDTTTFYEIMNFYESVSHPSVPSLNFVFLLALPVAFSKDLMFGNCHWTCDYCITKHFHVNDEHFGHELQVMETSTAI